MPNRRHALSREAFERLVRDHHAAVHASSLRLVREPSVAHDVTQEVYLAVLEGRLALPREGGDAVERVLRWFAVKSSLAHLRAGANRRRREDSYAVDSEHERSDAGDARSADRVVEEGEVARLVARAVDALPEELRVPLCLRFHEQHTYASIGDALSISEPSAHDRVRRALERLRDALTRAGHGVLATTVEQHLGSAPASAAPVSLPHVQADLLALYGTGATAAVTSLPLAVAAFLALAVVAVAWIARPEPASSTSFEHVARVGLDAPEAGAGARSRATEITLGAQPEDDSERVAVDAHPDAGASIPATPMDAGTTVVEGRGTLRGLVLDATGTPAGGREVHALSVERSGKFPRLAAAARTAPDGTFALEVDVLDAEGTSYHLVAGYGGTLEVADTERIARVLPGTVVDAGTFQLRPELRDEPGSFTLDVNVTDAHGRPVPEAVVVLHRRVRTAGSFGETTWEAGARVDASGHVRLAGEHVGPKRLSIDARDAGHRRLVREFDLAPGSHTLALALEPALEIRGRLFDVDGGPVTRPRGESRFGNALSVHTFAGGADGEWILGDLEDDGSFVLHGLDPGTYELGIGGATAWSPICRDGIVAGTTDVRIELKRADDPRDHGDHCGEIHARLVDAATRAPVRATFEALEVLGLDDLGMGADVPDDVVRRDALPLHLDERPVQREFSGVAPEASDAVHANGLRAGTYVLAIRVPGYAPAFVGPVTLRAREVRAGSVVALERPVELTGRVLDPDGRPVAGTLVRVGGAGSATTTAFAETDADVLATAGRPRLSQHGLVRTDDEGRFRLASLPPGMIVTVGAFHARFAPVATAPTPVSSGGSIDVRFTRAR